MDVVLDMDDDGSGTWNIIHPNLGQLYTLEISEPDEFGSVSLLLWDNVNNKVLDENTFDDPGEEE